MRGYFIVLLCLGSVGFRGAFASPPEPELVSIQWNEDITQGLSAEQREVLEAIQKFAQNNLKLYASFPWELPQTIFDEGKGAVLEINHGFPQPDAAEVPRLSQPPQPLSRAQQEQIRQEALFMVPSQDYPGQYHLWQVRFIKGRKNLKVQFHTHVARGLDHLTVYLPRSLWREGPHSVRRGVRNIYQGVLDLLNLFVGITPVRLPQYTPREVSTLIAQARRDAVTNSTAEVQYTKIVVEGVPLDFRLYDENTMAQLVPLVSALEKTSENQSQFYEAILASPDIEAVGPGLGQLLVNRGRALEVIAALEAGFYRTNTKQNFEELKSFYYNDVRQTLWNLGLYQEAILAERDAQFVLEKAPALAQNLRSQWRSAETHVWEKHIWRPQNYRILDTGIAKHELDSIPRTVSTTEPFWRLKGAWKRSLVWWNNWMYHLLVRNLKNGPLGVRSLFTHRPFFYDYVYDNENESIELEGPRQTTLVSRLQDFYEQRRELIENFEHSKAQGFWGRSLDRFFLFLKADVGLGFVMPTILVTGQTALTTANIAVSTGLAATSVVWAPLTSLMAMGFNAFIYEYDVPRVSYEGRGPHPTKKERERKHRLFPAAQAVARIGVGVSQMTAGFVKTVSHGAVGLGHLIWGTMRAGFHRISDAILMRVVKWWGQVPGRDSSWVRRVDGPDLTKNYVFKMDPSFALAALWAQLELEELRQFEGHTLQKLRRPLSQIYGQFTEPFMRALGLTEEQFEKIPFIREVRNTADALENGLTHAVEKRVKRYELDLGPRVKNHVRFSADLMNTTVARAAALARDFFESRILASLASEQRRDFWHYESLQDGDWYGFVKKRFVKLWGEKILEPLAEQTELLQLSVKTPPLSAVLQSQIDQMREPVIEIPPLPPNPTREQLMPVTAARLCSLALVRSSRTP